MFKTTLKILVTAFFILAATSVSFAQGRKMGLFVGINEYLEKEDVLQSCVNDALNMRKRLSRDYGFDASNTSLLTDARATRRNILDKLAYYERQTLSGDLFVFYYSGHGGIFPDALSEVNDETEMVTPPAKMQLATGYYDSTLVPIDSHLSTSGKSWGNSILDDELHKIFSRFTDKGVQVIFISDSCFSGTLAKSFGDFEMTKFASAKALRVNSPEWNQAARKRGAKAGETFNNLFLAIGSSQDNQTSLAGGPHDMSLFTRIFLAKLDEYNAANKIFTYQSVLNVVKPEVNRLSRQTQTPRLDDRFFDSALLNRPIFSLPSGNSPAMSAACTPTGIRIVIKVTDGSGTPLSDASLGILIRNITK